MIQEEYVSFEIAKLLKEKGFDADCPKRYSLIDIKGWDGDIMVDISKNSRYSEAMIYIKESICCPTQSLAMRWLREEHHIHIEFSPYTKDKQVLYDYVILQQVFHHKHLSDGELEVKYNEDLGDLSYEEACETAIKYCLENLI